MLRTISVVTALQLLAWTPALACAGQVGTAIFSDNFADDSGGWDETPPVATVVPPGFIFALNETTVISSQNLTFNAIDGDYCMDIVLPPPIASNNQFTVGLEFWATDYNNFMLAQVSSDGSGGLTKLVSGTWSNIADIAKVPGFKSGPNVTNSLRVTALSGTITIYLNGTLGKGRQGTGADKSHSSIRDVCAR